MDYQNPWPYGHYNQQRHAYGQPQPYPGSAPAPPAYPQQAAYEHPAPQYPPTQDPYGRPTHYQPMQAPYGYPASHPPLQAPYEQPSPRYSQVPYGQPAAYPPPSGAYGSPMTHPSSHSQPMVHSQLAASSQPETYIQPAPPTHPAPRNRPVLRTHSRTAQHPTTSVESPERDQIDLEEEDAYRSYLRAAYQNKHRSSIKKTLRRQYGESKFPFLPPPFNPGDLYWMDRYPVDEDNLAIDDQGRSKRKDPAMGLSRLPCLDRDENFRPCYYVYARKMACPYPNNNECVANHNVTRDQLLWLILERGLHVGTANHMIRMSRWHTPEDMLPENRMEYFPPREEITEPTPKGTMTEAEITEWRNGHDILPSILQQNADDAFELGRLVGFYEGWTFNRDSEESQSRLEQISQAMTPYHNGTFDATPALRVAMDAIDAIPRPQPFTLGTSQRNDDAIISNISVSRRRRQLRTMTISAEPSASNFGSEDASDRE